MYRNKVLPFLWLVALLAGGCSLFDGKPDTPQEYIAWMGEQSHGLRQTITVHGLIITLTYLPSEYLVYREMENGSTIGRDSLLAMYKHSRAFMVEFAPDSTKGNGDILYKDIESFGDYVERVHTMNFSLDEYMILECGGTRYKPTFSFFENSYSLDPRRKAIVMFTPAKSDKPLVGAESMNMVFYDEIFHTGIHRFSFEKSALQNIPMFPFTSDRQLM
jgi:hypothetical protein